MNFSPVSGFRVLRENRSYVLIVWQIFHVTRGIVECRSVLWLLPVGSVCRVGKHTAHLLVVLDFIWPPWLYGFLLSCIGKTLALYVACKTFGFLCKFIVFFLAFCGLLVNVLFLLDDKNCQTHRLPVCWRLTSMEFILWLQTCWLFVYLFFVTSNCFSG